MGCRGQFWTIIGALALLWVCGGIFYAVSSSQSIGQQVTATLTAGTDIDSATAKSIQDTGTGSAFLTTAAIFFCTGVPIMLIAGSLANGAKRDYQQQQQLALQQQQTYAMQQMAAQAAVQRPVYQAAPMADVRPQFDAARELIKAKQYDAARNLLKTINHPTAQEWLQKLDKMQSK